MEKMNKLEFLKIKNNDYSLQDHSLLWAFDVVSSAEHACVRTVRARVVECEHGNGKDGQAHNARLPLQVTIDHIECHAYPMILQVNRIQWLGH